MAGNDWSWGDGKDLAGLSRAVSPLQDQYGLDPEELRADPAKRAAVMNELKSPFATQDSMQAALKRVPPAGAATALAGAAPAPAAPPQAAPPAPAPAMIQPQRAPLPPQRPPAAPQVTGAQPAATAPTGNGSGGGSRSSAIEDAGMQALQRGLDLGGVADKTVRDMAASPGPDTAALEQQRTKDATPTPAYDSPGHLKDEYRPSIGRRIIRGVEAFGKGGVFGVVDPGSVGAVPYGAPNQQYNREEISREARLGSEDQQIAQRVADFKAQTDARKAGAQEARAGVTAYKDVAVGAKDLLQAGNTQQKNLGNLAEHGLKAIYDDTGNFTGVEDDPNSASFQAKQAMTDLKQAEQNLTEARTNAANADPNTPAGQAAIRKMKDAEAGHSAAMMRARSQWGRYMQSAYGVGLDGGVLPGATQIADEGGNQTVVGMGNASHAVKAQSSAAQFNDVHGAIDALETAARSMVAKGEKPDSALVAAALSQPAGTSGAWLQAHVVKSNLSPEQRDYVTQLVAAHENIQALRKSAGGGVSDSQVDRLMEMLPNASTPDLDYFLRQTGQIRATASRLGLGVATAKGGLHVRGQGGGNNQPPPANGAQPASADGGSFWNKHPQRTAQ